MLFEFQDMFGSQGFLKLNLLKLFCDRKMLLTINLKGNLILF